VNISAKIIELLSERLKNARESKALNISSISNRIRVREEFLWAMESGNWNELPPGVHGRGLIRLYAKELAVSVSEMDSSQRTSGDDDTPISHSSLSHFLGIKTSAPKVTTTKPIDSYIQPEVPSKPLLPHMTPSFMSMETSESPSQAIPKPSSYVSASTVENISLPSGIQLPQYKNQILKTNTLLKSLLPFFFTYKKWIALAIALTFIPLIIIKTHVLNPVTLRYMEETPVMSQSPKLESTVPLTEESVVPSVEESENTPTSLAQSTKEQITTKEPVVLTSQDTSVSPNKSFLEVNEVIQVQVIADGKIVKSGKQEIGSIPLEFEKTLTLLIEDGSKVNLNFKGWELGPLAKNKRKRKIILHNKDFSF